MTADGDGRPRQRVDKWLWFARLARTRTAAQKLAVSGRVRVNLVKNHSASRLLAPGDVLTVATPSGIRVLKVVAPGDRRRSADEARQLYQDLSPAPANPRASAREERSPRPDKRQRRAIAAFQRSVRDDFSPDEG